MTTAPLPYLCPAAYGPLNTAAIRSAPCQMSLGERLFLYTMVYVTRPLHYCEIGSAQGGSAIIAATALHDTGHAHAEMSLIDPRFDLDKTARQMLAPRARFHEGPSGEMLPRVAAQARQPIDFLLIDGDHSYEGTLQDIVQSFALVAPGAHVLVHDAFNPPIRDAIADGIRATGFVDCGLTCVHGNPLDDSTYEDGRWAGQQKLWGGLYQLRKKA